MSDNIPFDVQMKIMKMFPVKSLIQFRSVSKLWKSVIDSYEFISNYHVNNPQLQHHQLIRYEDVEEKYVAVLDDETFPQNKSFLTVPMSVNQLDNPAQVMGSSQGLFCFYNHNRYPREDSGTAVLWNPSIRKSVVINVPNVLDRPYATNVGFAVCPHTNDPKLVKIISYSVENNPFDSGGIPWKIEVYTLRFGVWRNLSINVPTERISLTRDQQVLEGFIYFLSIDRPYVGRVVDRPFVGPQFCPYETNYVIMSFDTINEEFTKISLPNCIHINRETSVIMSNLRGYLVVMTYDTVCANKPTDIWTMDHGVTKSFNKLFCIDPLDGCMQGVIGFRKSGEALIIMGNGYDISDDDSYVDSDDHQSLSVNDLESEHMDNSGIPDDHVSLFVYDPYTDHMDNIGISGKVYPFFTNCYMETLLLLNH